MGTIFWSRTNEPIGDVLEWAALYENEDYRLIAYDVEGSHAVSTVWSGLDHSHQIYVTDETAMIFETAFLIDDVVVDTVNWHTEAGALGGHAMMCVKLLGRPPRPEHHHRERIVAQRQARWSRRL